MGATTSTFDSMLKEFYVDKIPELVNMQVKLKEHFAKRNGAEYSTDGRRVVYPVHVGRNTGVGAVAEGANLPTAGYQQYQTLIATYKFNYGRIQLTAQTMKQSMSSKGAFRKAVDEEIKREAKDVGREVNRQLWGFGRGDLCHADGAVSGTTTNVKNPGGVTGTINANRFLRVGDIIAYITSAAVEDVDSVATVSASGSSFTTTNSVTASDNAIIVRCSTMASTAVADTGYAHEIMGMLGHIDDGSYVATYNNIIRATYPIMNSHRVAAGNSVLTLNMIQKAYDAAEQRGNGTIKTMWGHHSARREYLSLLQTYRRYSNEMAKTPDGGYKGAALETDVEYAERPFKVDRDAPYGIIFGVDDSNMFRYVLSEGEWADEDGRILLRVSGQDSYEARFRIFDEYVCDAPNTCFVISGLKLAEDPEVIQNI